MEEGKIYIVNGNHWAREGKELFILCPDDRTPMRDEKNQFVSVFDQASIATCPVCAYRIDFPFPFATAKKDVARIMLAKKYKDADIVDIDGVNTPVLKKKVASKDDKYFASVQINESKRGPQLVIYAGKKGAKEKAQIFVTPETKKMSFDHKDVKPTDIFAKVTAEFTDGSVNEIKRKGLRD